MSTTTLLTGTASTLGGTTAYTVDNKKINPGKLKNVVVASTISTGSAITSAGCNSLINQAYLSKIQVASMTSYVESMSDEELEHALLALNLVEENEIKSDVKMV